VNRKLIRTTLAEVKEREQQLHQAAQQAQQAQQARQQAAAQQQAERQAAAQQQQQAAAQQQAQPKKKIPPEQTNAETFYYKKQMDARTPMVLVLQDGEELHGTIEWYDKGSIKLHRLDGPNLLILKHNIKYMYKDQAEEGAD
jgi:sRNA-binding regulator protein Hfq